MDMSIGGDSMLAILASNRHDSDPATVTPLLCWLSTKHNLIDLATKAFPCKQIENTSKKMVNTQSNIADVNEANINGVRALDSKGLVDTVEKMQEQGPWITAKGLGVTITMHHKRLNFKNFNKTKPKSKQRRLLSFNP
jgi:hypothetical protein